MHNHVMASRNRKVSFKKNIQFDDTTVHKMQASLFHPVLLSRASQVEFFCKLDVCGNPESSKPIISPIGSDDG